MNRHQIVRGVTLVVDVCWRDGVWFDGGEVRAMTGHLVGATVDDHQLTELVARLAKVPPT